MIAVARRIDRFQLIALRVTASGITTLTTAIRSPSASFGRPAAAAPTVPRYSWHSAQSWRNRIGW